MSHVFISYKRDDFIFAQNVELTLKAENLSAWRDNKIKGGEHWNDEIEKALRDAFAVLVIVTPASRASEYVTFEWSYALGLGKKVIPLLLQGTDDDMHPRLSHLQGEDFRGQTHNFMPLVSRLNELFHLHLMSLPQSNRLPPAPIESSNNSVGTSEEIFDCISYQYRVSKTMTPAKILNALAGCGLLNAQNKDTLLQMDRDLRNNV